jgi:hypothetical protein
MNASHIFAAAAAFFRSATMMTTISRSTRPSG